MVDKAEFPTDKNTQYRESLRGLLKAMEESGAVDLMELRDMYREWANSTGYNLGEDFDPYTAVIDDFFSVAGKFESFAVIGKDKGDEKVKKEMENSIDLQRDLISLAVSSLDFDNSGEVVFADSDNLSKLKTTLGFIEDICLEKQFLSRDSGASKYLSGLRSMICASLLAKAGNCTVEFADSKYDVEYDLDMVFETNRGVRMGIDVTTKSKEVQGVYGFSLFIDSKYARVPNDVRNNLKLDHCSKLVLPSTWTYPEFYTDKNVGIPSKAMVSGFRKLIA